MTAKKEMMRRKEGTEEREEREMKGGLNSPLVSLAAARPVSLPDCVCDSVPGKSFN